MNFQTVGSLECLDTVEFGAQWPGAPGSGARGDTEFKKMSNEIKNSKLVVLSKYKHSFLIEAPSEVSKNIIEFVKNI